MTNDPGSSDTADTPTDEEPLPKEQEVLRSIHTQSFADILQQLNCSLAVTTYQSGHLVFLRAENGVVNTHFRKFRKPMGMAIAPERLALGTAQEIWDFRNVRALLPRLEPAGVNDGCFLPRAVHITGDIQIHEMAFHGNELWFVNTVFSCLCTHDYEHSFVPRWRPSFLTDLAPGDRCHLNGLGMAGGKPKWVTALGKTNEPRGWRENKKNGGIVIDIESNEIVSRGLSMPHSPRWYANRLWILESGTGSLGVIDLDSGRYEPLCRLPGFTRGLDFVGHFAFIGLSQVRETAIFSGIPITEHLRQEERCCGVWVVDIRTGQTVAFLKFEDAVQEIFAVSAIRYSKFPDLIRHNPELMGSSYVLPTAALKEVPADLVREHPAPQTTS